MTLAELDHPQTGRRGLPVWVVAAVLTAAVMAGAVFVQVGRSTLSTAGVVAAPQQYLALAVSDAASVPTKAATGAAVHISFTITNAFSSSLNQRWQVTISEARGPGEGSQPARVIAEGSTAVPAGGTTTVPVETTMPSGTGGVTISVSATGQDLAPLTVHLAREANTRSATVKS